MDNQRIVEFVENSFLKPLLSKEGVTDISYNGESLFYQDNHKGRKRALIHVAPEEVSDFLRQIANLSEKQFSYMNPVLDVSFARYRLNAMFSSIVRVLDKKSFSFSLRIGKEGSAISADSGFFGGKSRSILLKALADGSSIVVAGETGSGKTELQKWLLLNMADNTRVIVIDNVEELELSRVESGIDLTSWRIDSRFPESSFSSLIRTALRNNPDYILVAEVRGDEMHDALRSAMSGHPIITTLHARDLESVPARMARMAQIDPKMSLKELIEDIYHHFDIVVYLSKAMVAGSIERRVEKIGYLDKKKMEIGVLYQREEAQ